MNPEYRRKQIIKVAKKVFATYGYHKTNIEMICKKAGTSRGTIYRYFKNKEAIFIVILEESIEEMNRHIVEGYEYSVSSLRSREEIMEAYVETMERLFTYLLSDRDFARIAFEVSAGVNKQFAQIRQEGERRNIALIKTVLERWRNNNLVRQDLDTDLAALRMRGAMEIIARTFLFNPKQKLSREEIRSLVSRNAALDLCGILIPDTPHG